VKRVLVTGASGFAGTNALSMSEQLLKEWGLQLIALDAGIDITDESAIKAALMGQHFDAVWHLAAISFVPDSVRDPALTYRVNFFGTYALLAALRSARFQGRFLLISSSDVYGLVDPEHLPIDERIRTAPRSPYAVSKVAAEALCQQWFHSEGLDLVIARPFNHVGAGQRPDFVLPSVAYQIARIKAGLQAPQIALGDLDVTRDFCDVEDIITGYAALTTRGIAGQTYNLCSGQERVIADVVNELIQLSGLSVEVVADPARLRRAEQRRMCGSAAKIHSISGWKPLIPWVTTLARVLRDAERVSLTQQT
jgi:GDP-4-dehydro-6-deoxy-D-mannose reductase